MRTNTLLAFLVVLAVVGVTLTSCGHDGPRSVSEPYGLLSYGSTAIDAPPAGLLDASSPDVPSEWRIATLKEDMHVYLGGDKDSICILLIVDPEDGSYLSCRHEYSPDPLYIRATGIDGLEVVVFAVEDNIRSVVVGNVACVSANNVVAYAGITRNDMTAEVATVDDGAKRVDISPPDSEGADVTTINAGSAGSLRCV